jgi:hypothetical protein
MKSSLFSFALSFPQPQSIHTSIPTSIMCYMGSNDHKRRPPREPPSDEERILLIEWSTSRKDTHNIIVSPAVTCNSLSRRRSGDDLACLQRRTPAKENAPTIPTEAAATTTRRKTRDISKLAKSPQLSRLQRQRDMYRDIYGAESR